MVQTGRSSGRRAGKFRFDKTMSKPTFYEFFAGGGMARAGLGDAWECTFANDICKMKAEVYRKNWSPKGTADHLLVRDVGLLSSLNLPGKADLAWASFPCQDLSLAGKGKGIGEESEEPETRSGAFWGFWSLMRQLAKEKRKPRSMVLENVTGFLSANNSQDFRIVCDCIASLGYKLGALVIDAKYFVPQSRPRVFLVAIDSNEHMAAALHSKTPKEPWHPKALTRAFEHISKEAQARWCWWDLPVPPKRNTVLSDLIEEIPVGVEWNSDDVTKRLIGMMSPANYSKLVAAQEEGQRVVGTIYKRTRIEQGARVQRAEVRFDGVAGCLRTPGGGSSRQTIIIVEGSSVQTRLLSPGEAAALMGLQDFWLPARYNDAYHVAGDGVCVPAVRYIAESIIEPMLELSTCTDLSAAA
ncbi:MAG: DNA cytosine methyltransferase [Pseudomonadota bacterium]